MTTTEKVRLVDRHKEERGLNRCLQALALPRSTYYYRRKCPDGPSEDNQKLMRYIRTIIQGHPGYGYRRILPEAEARLDERINHKRLRRILNAYASALPRQLPIIVADHEALCSAEDSHRGSQAAQSRERSIL
jgi:hypothetical protein